MKKTHKKNTSRIFTVLAIAFFLLAAMGIASFIITLQSNRARSAAYALRLDLNAAVHELAVSSEVLSRWMRSLAVVGGELQYEAYQEELDRAGIVNSMRTFTELSTCAYELEILENMRIDREYITRLEQEVFRLYAEGYRAEAMDLAFSAEFSALSTSFIRDATQLIRMIDGRTREIVDSTELRVRVSAPIAVASWVLLTIVGAFALLGFGGRTRAMLLIALAFIAMSAAAIRLSWTAIQYSHAMSDSYALRANLSLTLYEMELSTERMTRLARSFAVQGGEHRYDAYRMELGLGRFNAAFYTFSNLDAPAEIFNDLVNLTSRVALLRQLDEQLLQLRISGYYQEAVYIAFSAEYDYLELPINAASRRIREDIEAFTRAEFDAARAGHVTASRWLAVVVISLVFLGLAGLYLRRWKISPEDKITVPAFIANATISAKLFASFSIVIAGFLFNIVVVNYFNTQIARLNRYNTEVMAARTNAIALYHQQFTEMRRLLHESFMNREWLGNANAGERLYFERRISETYARMTELSERGRELIADDSMFPPVPYDSRLYIMAQIEDYVYLMYETFRGNFFIGSDMSQDHGNVLRYADSAEIMIGVLGNFGKINQGRVNAYILQYRIQVNMVIGLAVISAVALALISARAMIRTFNKRIKSIENVARAVALGDFETIIEINATDEISRIFNDMSRVFLRLIKEIKQVFHQNKIGNNKTRIDVSNYYGGHLDAALSINDMLDSISKMMDHKEKMIIAEQNSRAKSKFLTTMSHEIRTPITAVLGISEIQLQNTNLSPDIEEAFAKIHSSANILLGIINDILDLSKIESGKMEIIPEKYDVAALLSDVAHLNLSYLGSKEIDFTLDVDKNLPAFLKGDDLRIKQVLNNLLSNAFKYTEKGSVRLEMYKKGEPRPGHINVSIVISDTGSGMNREQVQSLFDEYSRFNMDKGFRFIEGTGLGMPITYNLTHMMGGTIDVDSEEGVGTTVSIVIPQGVASTEILTDHVIENLRVFKLDVHSAFKRFAFTPEPMPYGSVLIVDDTEANLYVAKGLLEFYSLNIETCSSGYDAIEKVEQGNVYDIIFMDHMMPGIDGIETVEKLRGMGYAHPIVALTANALVGQAEMFLRNGFNGFLSKPIQTVHMNAILVKYIRDKQPPEVIEAAIAASPPMKDGINDYQKNDGLLQKLRADFAKNYKNGFHDITKALVEGDTTTAHIIAHSVKSHAAMINEPALSQIAGQLEGLLDDGKMPPQELLSSLETEIAAALENIGDTESESKVEPPPANAVLDEAKAAALFDELEPLLDSGYTKSLNYIDRLREIPETAMLISQIEELDFKTASKTLKTLREALGV